MSDQSRNATLLSKIVNWPNAGDDPEDEGPLLFAGRGEIVALLEGPFLLIRHLPRNGDAEPSSMMILSMFTTGLKFFDTLEDEAIWYAWVCNDPKPLVTLVKG